MPDVAGMMVINFIAPFVPGHFDLRDIDDNNIITRVHMRCENGFGLAADDRRYLAGNAAQGLVRRIDHDPLLNDVLRFG